MTDDDKSAMCPNPIYHGVYQIFYELYNSEQLQSQLMNLDHPLGDFNLFWGYHL